jgi:hypothetical protein
LGATGPLKYSCEAIETDDLAEWLAALERDAEERMN